MMALNTTIRNKFREAFEQKCFQLMIEAYQTSITEKAIQLNWNENDISSVMHSYIKVNPARLRWNIVTNREAHIPNGEIAKGKGFADKELRIDFRLTSIISKQEYDYFFEAKNLRQNDSALKRRYIDTGINNFISGKYKDGSLVGYLLEGKTEETIRGINSLLEKDKRGAEILFLKSQKLLKSVYESNHTGIFKLKHLIFDFINI